MEPNPLPRRSPPPPKVLPCAGTRARLAANIGAAALVHRLVVYRARRGVFQCTFCQTAFTGVATRFLTSGRLTPRQLWAGFAWGILYVLIEYVNAAGSPMSPELTVGLPSRHTGQSPRLSARSTISTRVRPGPCLSLSCVSPLCDFYLYLGILLTCESTTEWDVWVVG